MDTPFELEEDETVEKTMSGDYWKKVILGFSQKRGKYWLTNKKIVFRGGFMTELDIEYKQIASLRKCCIGPFPFLPFGILVELKDGTDHRLSVLGRSKILELLQSKI